MNHLLIPKMKVWNSLLNGRV